MSSRREKRGIIRLERKIGIQLGLGVRKNNSKEVLADVDKTIAAYTLYFL